MLKRSPSLIKNVRFTISSCRGNETIKNVDKELWNLLVEEKKRQVSSLVLIASENFTSRGVLECVSSSLTNKYAEGYPDARYYGGNQFIDKVELLAQTRLLDLFRLKKPEESSSSAEWGVNVQPYSGSPANMAVYTGVLNPHDRLMGLHLPDGGHLTHGFSTMTKRISATSIFFESLPYKLHPETEFIDYDALERDALNYYPKLIVAGVTAYPRLLDYERFRRICDSVGALLLADMSHISGLVAGGVVPTPFQYADIVSSTTHKTLRGPRSGMIFYRRQPRSDKNDSNLPEPCVPIDQLESRINNAVFPSLQGGPHENAIAGVACMALEANSDEFASYAKQVLSNAQALASALKSRGIRLVSGGTDIHFVLVDLSRSPGKPQLGRGDGGRVQLISDLVGITLNKNTVPGDKSAQQPSGLRLGTPALTTRGFVEKDFEMVAELLDELLDITVLAKSLSKNLKTFRAVCNEHSSVTARIQKLRARVSDFVSPFPMPGYDEL